MRTLKDLAAKGLHLILLSGEPGIGKTFLVERFLEHARGAGAQTWVGRCPSSQSQGFQPFCEIVEQLARSDASRLGDEARDLIRLVPSLAGVLPGDLVPREVGPDQLQDHLCSCLNRALGRAVGTLPTVFVFEDLHWADFASTRVLDSLLALGSDRPLLLIGTYREHVSYRYVTRHRSETSRDLPKHESGS